jgi:hypothetical protein
VVVVAAAMRMKMTQIHYTYGCSVSAC